MDTLCPECRCELEVVEEKMGTFKRRFSEFEMKILVLKCPKCGKNGVLRLVPDLQMENFEFPL